MLKWALHIMIQRTQTSLQPSNLVHRVLVQPAAGRSRALHIWTQLCAPADGFASLPGEVDSSKAQGMSGCFNPCQTFCLLLLSQIPFMPISLCLDMLRGKGSGGRRGGSYPAQWLMSELGWVKQHHEGGRTGTQSPWKKLTALDLPPSPSGWL